jgi:hypothetical protein
MNNLDAQATARMILGDRVREASQQRLVRECRRGERAVIARTPEPPQRHSRLWILVHFRRAYG